MTTLDPREPTAPPRQSQGRLCHYCGSGDIAVTTPAPKPHFARLTCRSCGRGIGFAPKPVAFAPEFPLPFGIYSGNTLAQIWETARGRDYLKWAASEWADQPRIQKVIEFFLKHMADTSLDGAASQPADDEDEIGF